MTKPMLTEIIFATHNKHKLDEVRAMLSPLRINIIGAADVGLPDVDETGATFAENALLKADAGFKLLGKPVLAEDAGLCINALGGMPGLRTARFADESGGYPAAFRRINEMLGDNPDRSAYFNCTMALVFNENSQHIFTGRMTGRIAHNAYIGGKQFGYDPIFMPDGFDKTTAELGDEIKNTISHRFRALEQIAKFLLD